MGTNDTTQLLEDQIKKLTKTLELRKNMVKHLPQQVWVIDSDGRIVMSNHNSDKVLSQLVGKQDFDPEGLNLYDEIAKHAPKPIVEMIRRNDAIAMGSDQPMVFEEMVESSDVKKFFISYKRRYVNPETSDVYLLGVSMDITGLKQEEEKISDLVGEIRAVSEAKKTFIQSFRHDLQTPISNILGAVDLMQHSPDESDMDFFISSIQASAVKLKEYVSQLEDVSTPERLKHDIELKALEIRPLLENVISSFYVFAKNKSLTLTLDIDPNVPDFVESDPMRLYRIVSNLVSNGIKYTEKGNIEIQVLFTAVEDLGILEFHVIDTGIGIDPSFQKAIFSPLLRLNERQHDVEGQGLGLSIVKNFTEELGGKISVRSTPGEGSQFIVMLPVSLPIRRDDVSE